jgi:alpha-galactosidase
MLSAADALSYVCELTRPRAEEIRAVEEWVQAMSGPASAERVPFSFTLDGRGSPEFIADWPVSDEAAPRQDKGCFSVRRVLRSPDRGMEIVWDLVSWSDFPAAEWVLTFKNTGDADSQVLSDVRALDLALPAAPDTPTTLHAINPDLLNARAYLPYEEEVPAGGCVELAAVSGRSSNGAFPFFTVAHGGRIWVVAVGWSGRWRATIERDAGGGARIRVALGKFAARLHAGERVRSPRMLVMSCDGDPDRAHNMFRALMLAHYVPRQDGAIQLPPFAAQNFDIYFRRRPDWATQQGQVAFVRDRVAGLGFDTYWLDAAWFPRAFPTGVGSWYADPESFPDGLRPVSDEAHKHGMQFLVWFETGRVAPDTQIWNEHPEWVLRGTDPAASGVFDYGNPEALGWLTGHVLRIMEEYGIDMYREDFNTDPAVFWDARDEPDRAGICENRWITGFYKYWDALAAARPGLFIDNCASGGRRIDLETCMRAIPLWRSDTGCSAGNSDGDQIQSAGLSRYVPLNTVGCHSPQPYDVRSTATAGLIAQWDLYAAGFDRDLARASVEEVKRFREYWLGEMHLLIGASPDASLWHALQLHREDLASGIILVFRRGESPYVSAVLRPHALRADATYELTYIDDQRRERVTTVEGAALERDGIAIDMPERRSSMIVHYRAIRLGVGGACPGRPAGGPRVVHGRDGHATPVTLDRVGAAGLLRREDILHGHPRSWGGLFVGDADRGQRHNGHVLRHLEYLAHLVRLERPNPTGAVPQ